MRATAIATPASLLGTLDNASMIEVRLILDAISLIRRPSNSLRT